MKNAFCCIAAIVLFACCNSKKVPDVSNIKVQLQAQRFDQDFFATDTNHIDQSLQLLHEKYPSFLQDFIFNILSLPPQPDSAKAVERQVKYFIETYKHLDTDADQLFTNISNVQADITSALKFVKFYFPTYKLPTKLITFVGPVDSYGNILTTDALAVGLQLYMGADYPLYKTGRVQEQYPAYVSRRFKKEYIAINSIKTIINDLYPDNSTGKPLVEQMVQAGKRLYILEQLMPNVNDTLKTGYTKAQLDGCYANQSTIWSYFVQNDLLFSTDPSVTRDYMNDAPKTQVFGDASPGFIGQFIGWQIVKKWMNKNNNTSLEGLIKMSEKIIFEEAKYKP